MMLSSGWLIHFLFLVARLIEAANWAQVSGDIDQNVVVPYVPGPNHPHWGARYGMVTIAVNAPNVSALNRLYVMGGDTYDGKPSSVSQQPGLGDLRWEMGYKNDVWRMSGTEWLQKGDPRLRGPHHQKVPKVQAILEWTKIEEGVRPPSGVSYNDWIACEFYFRNLPTGNQLNCDNAPERTQWSPRRHHAGLYFKDYLWVMGGRAREFIDLPEERSIGGIIGPHVQDIPTIPENREQRFKTQREASILKSDVWRSADGMKWDLVNPGCRVPQRSLIAQGFKDKDGKGAAGLEQFKCNPADPSPCYGAEVCDPELRTCVCSIWSPREQHAVAAYGKYMYLSGGYASRLYSQFSNCGPYACGDTDAGAYRFFLADIWQSENGNTWTRITESAFSVQGDPIFGSPLGRGGHQMLTVIEKQDGEPYLWVVGGRGGDNSVNGGDEVYFNDIWRSPLKDDSPDTWRPLRMPANVVGSPRSPKSPDRPYFMPWEPRTGHQVVLEEGTPANLDTRTLYVYGGVNNGTYLEDLWSWRLDVRGEGWREDFTAEAYYSTGVGSDFVYRNDSPSKYYVTPDSDLSMLQRYWVPVKPSEVIGEPVEKRVYLSEEKVAIMRSVGVKTIRDLADIDLYTLLKLRGFDYPQVAKKDRLQLYDICDYRALAMALVKKCTLTIPSLYDGERNQPWNIIPEFGGAPPAADKIKWHGRPDYDFLLPDIDDPVKLTDNWDGCTYTPQIQGLFGPNVDGLGFVDQVLTIRDPAPELEELFCRQTPGPRAHHSMVMFEERLYLLGGKRSDSSFHADAWYRDSKLPIARFGRIPGSRDVYPWFHFLSDKPGSFFEYRVWDPNLYKEIRPWTRVTHKTSVSWLDWRMGGPGNGRYQLYVRAVDPAGNRDARFIMNQNVYNWYYLSPTPWDIILGTIFGFLFLCFLAYMEYRRRVKKAAMERYAMKRMRRKFKAMQRDINGRSVDWRTLYMESKQAEEAGLKDKKKKKKSRDKNAEKREKDRKKREKEKELIKKKLQASKTHKDKIKQEKDLEATADVAPKKLGGKKSRVAPGSGEGDDDSDLGLEDMLLADEEAKAGASLKKIKQKPSATTGNNKMGIAAGDDNDGIEGGDEPMSMVQQKAALSAKAPVGTAVAIGDSSKEVGAGQLKASADTETGTKQRKVNKRLKEYDNAGGAEAKKDM